MTSLEYIEYLQRKLDAANQTYRKLDRYDKDALLIEEQRREIKQLRKDMDEIRDHWLQMYFKASQDIAKKFADLVEFHSVATMKDGVEYFTISALGLKEILSENFNVKDEAKPDQSVAPESTLSETIAMEGSHKFKRIIYIPTCRYGCDDCIHDPAYIKATYPDWYAELYGKQSPEEAAKDPRGCAACSDANGYDDEDK